MRVQCRREKTKTSRGERTEPSAGKLEPVAPLERVMRARQVRWFVNQPTGRTPHDSPHRRLAERCARLTSRTGMLWLGFFFLLLCLFCQRERPGGREWDRLLACHSRSERF